MDGVHTARRAAVGWIRVLGEAEVTDAPIKSATDLARAVGDILEIYLTGDGMRKSEMGIANVRQVPMTQCTTQLLGPGVSIRTMDGKEYHVCVVEQEQRIGGRWIDTTHHGE